MSERADQVGVASGEVFEGPRVLWSRPGQIVLGFAAAMIGVWLVQDVILGQDDASAEPVVRAAMPTDIDRILAEADLDTAGGGGTVGGPKESGQEPGLVNLFKTLVGADGSPEGGEAQEAGQATPAQLAEIPPASEGVTPEASTPGVGEGQPSGVGKADAGSPSGAGQAGVEPVAEAPVGEQRTQAPAARATQEGRKVVRIEDPNGAMKPFYEALRRTEQKKGTTRVLHWGDSVIVADMVTSTVRRKLQERFGDSGHGFMLVSIPWEYYIHQQVEHAASDNWRDTLITHGVLKDKQYGIGGVVTTGHSKGAWATFGTVDKGKTGRNLSKFQVFYGTSPDGGEVLIQVDGQDKATFSTRGEGLTDKLHTVTFPDGPHDIRLQSNGGGPVRLYGVVLERETPGVVYDCLGVTGSRASTFIRFDVPHFERQLAQRNPDLMIVMTGSNQSKFKGMDMAQYEQEYTTMVKQIRKARPNSTCLVASAPDRAEKTNGQLTTSPLIPKIVAIQHKVALANGCAFWNTYEAMGGQNAMLAWHRHRPRLASGDYTHLTMAGGEVLGALLYEALMAGY